MFLLFWSLFAYIIFFSELIVYGKNIFNGFIQ